MSDLRRYDDLSLVVQAGGESRRMGQSKALVPFLGEPLIMRPLRLIEPIASEVIVTTNEPERYGFLKEDARFAAVRLCTDLVDARGALNGLYTALASATLPYVAIVACDMVFPSPRLFEAERALLVSSGVDVAVPRNEHGFEPFHAVYRRASCLDLVSRRIDEGDTRASGWFESAQVVEISSEEANRIEPRGGYFMNINTPDALEALQQRIVDGEMR